MVENDSPQELEMLIPQVKEFYFDPKKMVFVIGSDHTEQSLKEAGDIFYFKGGVFDINNKPKPNDHTLGLSVFATLIEFPQLRDWVSNLNSEERKSISNQVVDSMEQVYRNLAPTVKLPKDIRGGFMGFNAVLEPDGSFRLSTFGNCACLGRNPYSHIFYPEHYPDLSKTTFPLEYELHNDDSAAQRLSLYAGAGTLAWLKTQ